MKSIRTYFILYILVITTIIFTAQTAFSFYLSNKVTTNELQNSLLAQAGEQAAVVNESLLQIGVMTNVLASDIVALPPGSNDNLYAIITEYLQKSDLIFGGGFWYEPYYSSPTEKYFGPYLYKDGSEIVTTLDYSNAEYDYFSHDWYTQSISTENQAHYSEPYLDEVSGITMMTVASPIIKSGQRIGVTTMDISIDNLDEYVKGLKIGETGLAFVVTSEGYYLATSDPEKNMTVKIADENADLAQKITTAEATGLTKVKFWGQDSYLAYSPIGETGAKLVVMLPVAEAESAMQKGLMINIGAFVVAILAFIILMYWVISNKIVAPIRILQTAMGRLAAGDLTEQADLRTLETKQNELGALARAFNSSIKNTRGLVADIDEAALTVAAASEEASSSAEQSSQTSQQIAITIGELAKGASEQADTSQQASSQVGKINHLIQGVTSRIEEANSVADNAKKIVNSGVEIIHEQKQNSIENKAASSAVATSIKALSEKSRKIEEIISVIGGIADQTNLLALNAAIEAARAGDQGRGFAVVADEVRKLAEQSGDATQEIINLIKEIQAGVTEAVNDVAKSEEIVLKQDAAVANTAEAFEHILASFETVSQRVSEISEQADQLKAQADGVFHNIEAIASVSEQSAAGTEQVAASTEEQMATMVEISTTVTKMAEMTERLQEHIQRFKLA
jgi:methyl-accepting chemotaxis protein